MEAMDEHGTENLIENLMKNWFSVECYRRTGSLDIISDISS